MSHPKERPDPTPNPGAPTLTRREALQGAGALAVSLALPPAAHSQPPTPQSENNGLTPAGGINADLPRLMVQAGHSTEIWAAAVSPNEKLAATGGRDWNVVLWDIATGKAIRTLLGHKQGIRIVVFSPDSQRLASVSDDNQLKVWAVSTGKLIRSFDLDKAPVSIAFSADANQVMVERNAQPALNCDLLKGTITELPQKTGAEKARQSPTDTGAKVRVRLENNKATLHFENGSTIPLDCKTCLLYDSFVDAAGKTFMTLGQQQRNFELDSAKTTDTGKASDTRLWNTSGPRVLPIPLRTDLVRPADPSRDRVVALHPAGTEIAASLSLGYSLDLLDTKGRVKNTWPLTAKPAPQPIPKSKSESKNECADSNRISLPGPPLPLLPADQAAKGCASLVYAPTGKHIAILGEHMLQLRDTTTGTILWSRNLSDMLYEKQASEAFYPEGMDGPKIPAFRSRATAGAFSPNG